MITAKRMMDKIKWDPRISPDKCALYYWDRIEQQKIKIHYQDITKIEGQFMHIEREGEIHIVPLHRLRKIINKGRVIWERKTEGK